MCDRQLLKLLSLLVLLAAKGSALAEDFPSPMLKEAMNRALQDCVQKRQFVIQRKTPFYAQIDLVRQNRTSDESYVEPFLTEWNKRDRFALGIGTRPQVSDGKPGTVLYFAIGSENPKGFGTGGVGFFVPKQHARASIYWLDRADGTLAFIGFEGVRYVLRMQMLQAIPEKR